MRVTQWLRVASAVALALGGALSAEAQEIKFWTLTFDNPSVTKAFETIIKRLRSRKSWRNCEAREPRDRRAQVRVARRERIGQAPDIYFMWAGLGLGGEFVKSGLALPMDKYYAQYKWDDEFIARPSHSQSSIAAAVTAFHTLSVARRSTTTKPFSKRQG